MAGTTAPLSFASLPLEIRAAIWQLTLAPRIITLVPRAYSFLEETSAVPWHRIAQGPLDNQRYQDPTQACSARFTAEGIHALAHAALQVSRESRDLVSAHGYRIWTMQDREGRVRNLWWNPSVDVVLFPEKRLGYPSEGNIAVNYAYWLRLFALQYPSEAGLATKLAVYTTQCCRGMMITQWLWQRIGNFKSLRELVIVVDEEEERGLVASLIRHNLSCSPRSAWALPQDVEEMFRIGHQRWPHLMPGIPAVRVVESVANVLSDQSLQIRLQCNPCEYLGMG